MKPIFEEERVFLNELLHIDLPTECWRSNSKIYLDCTCDKPLYTFSVEDNKARVTKDNTKLFQDYKQKNITELQGIYKYRIDRNITNSINFFYEYMFSPKLNHIIDDKFVLGHSSGKDSVVSAHMFCLFLLDLYQHDKNSYYEIINKTDINFANTSNDTADTYRFAKSLIEMLKEYVEDFSESQLVIMNPKEGWTQWLKRKNYFIPTVLTRNCCSTYKEGQISKVYDKKQHITHILGMRKYESTKRAKYEYIMDYDKCLEIFKTPNFPKTWVKVCPIVEWHDEEVWLYILREGLPYNNMYNLGFHRVGCLICPMQQNYIDLLIQKYYPNRWNWWMDVLEKNYTNTNVARRLHWTLDEYKCGKWKAGVSKIQEYISKKFTDERCQEVANILGIQFEMAKKYWNRECECGKKCNPTEIAMFYKMYGRFDGVEDTRKPKCKTCVCEDFEWDKKEYQAKYLEFREGGCNLF